MKKLMIVALLFSGGFVQAEEICWEQVVQAVANDLPKKVCIRIDAIRVNPSLSEGVLATVEIDSNIFSGDAVLVEGSSIGFASQGRRIEAVLKTIGGPVYCGKTRIQTLKIGFGVDKQGEVLPPVAVSGIDFQSVDYCHSKGETRPIDYQRPRETFQVGECLGLPCYGDDLTAWRLCEMRHYSHFEVVRSFDFGTGPYHRWDGLKWVRVERETDANLGVVACW